MEKQISRTVFVPKDSEYNELRPLAGIWLHFDDPGIERYLKINPEDKVVECLLQEKQIEQII